MLTQDRVREVFKYEDGNLIWVKKTGRGTRLGTVAGCLDNKGYRIVTLDGKPYKAHRLVFLLHHGYLPSRIDHRNTNKDDNRIENLRGCTDSENGHNTGCMKNSSTKVKGVDVHSGKFRARVCKEGKRFLVGAFGTLEEARLEIAKFRESIAGEFCRHE